MLRKLSENCIEVTLGRGSVFMTPTTRENTNEKVLVLETVPEGEIGASAITGREAPEGQQPGSAMDFANDQDVRVVIRNVGGDEGVTQLVRALHNLGGQDVNSLELEIKSLKDEVQHWKNLHTTCQEQSNVVLKQRRLLARKLEDCTSITSIDAMVELGTAKLAECIKAGAIPDTSLTFAAELLGDSLHSELVQSTLTPLLSHNKAYVREGAIYGLSQHLTTELRLTLLKMAESDDSEGVRAAAREALQISE